MAQYTRKDAVKLENDPRLGKSARFADSPNDPFYPIIEVLLFPNGVEVLKAEVPGHSIRGEVEKFEIR